MNCKKCGKGVHQEDIGYFRTGHGFVFILCRSCSGGRK